nr:MAG TPA: hypothetical protein [Caudoviricetes sp.]
MKKAPSPLWFGALSRRTWHSASLLLPERDTLG